MEIKQMQSVLLARGIRITDDDPIFTVLTLCEIISNDLVKKNLQHLNAANTDFLRFQVEIRAMGDAILSLAETLNIGRHLLSGENEQILEDVNSIKATLEIFAQEISVQMPSNEYKLHKLIEALNSSVATAVKTFNGDKSILHSRHEALLIQCINEISNAIGKLKGMESAIQETARRQAETAVSPIVEALKNRDHLSGQYYKIASDVYKTLADKAIYTTVILSTVFLVAVGGAFYAGMKIGVSSTAKNVSYAGNLPNQQSEIKRPR